MGTSDEFNPEARELCPDGACIGIIGPDGTCKECGMVSPTATQDPRNRGLRTENEVEHAEEELQPGPAAESAESAEPSDSSDSAEPGSESFEEDRELCPDGACIGVIGPGGTCKECGAAASG